MSKIWDIIASVNGNNWTLPLPCFIAKVTSLGGTPVAGATSPVRLTSSYLEMMSNITSSQHTSDHVAIKATRNGSSASVAANPAVAARESTWNASPVTLSATLPVPNVAQPVFGALVTVTINEQQRRLSSFSLTATGTALRGGRAVSNTFNPTSLSQVTQIEALWLPGVLQPDNSRMFYSPVAFTNVTSGNLVSPGFTPAIEPTNSDISLSYELLTHGSPHLVEFYNRYLAVAHYLAGGSTAGYRGNALATKIANALTSQGMILRDESEAVLFDDMIRLAGNGDPTALSHVENALNSIGIRADLTRPTAAALKD